MHISPIQLLLILTFLGGSTGAIADWLITGIAEKCAKGEKTFSLVPVIKLSSEDPAALPPPSGFTQLAYGVHEIRCAIKGVEINANIEVYPPADRGMCMGAGYVSINRLRVNRHTIFRDREPFNFLCEPNRVLNEITITVRANSTLIKTCTAKDWDWGVGFSDTKCNEQTLPR